MVWMCLRGSYPGVVPVGLIELANRSRQHETASPGRRPRDM